MTITVTFDPPLPSDSPSVFNTKAFTLLGDLNDWSTEANALASTVNSNASTSATNASNASNSADAAATSASNTAAIYDAFDDRYLGAKAVAPTLDNDGGALLTGALYFNTASNTMFVYTGSSWVATNASFAAPGPIGGTTPASGTFTTLTSTGNAALGDAEASDTHAIKGATTLLANSASAALTVTQTGAGNAFVVEDSASTDSTPFVINASGKTIVGHTASIPGAFSDEANIQSVVAGGTAQWAGYRFSADTGGANLYFYKSRSGTAGTNAVVLSGDICGGLAFAGADGTTYHRAATILGEIDGTPGPNDMPGRLVFSTTADGATSPTERMRIDSAGSLGIGGAAAAWAKVQTLGTYPSNSGLTIVNYATGTIPSSTTTDASGFWSELSTQAASFTLTNLKHFNSKQATIGATSAVANQFGFFADSTLTGATNNYGFYSNIASGTNRYNLYCAGTADNYMAGSLGVGGVASAGQTLVLNKNATGAATSTQLVMSGAFQSDVTTLANLSGTYAQTAGTAFTIPGLAHYNTQQGSFGSTTVTAQYGFIANSSLIGATNNYGFYSNIASAANRYNFYAAGSADNYFAGKITSGTIIAATSYVHGADTVATPAGGAIAFAAGTSAIGVYFGSGAPTVSAAKGSLYLRSDGSTTNDRMYVNTNGSTTWTAVTTAA